MYPTKQYNQVSPVNLDKRQHHMNSYPLLGLLGMRLNLIPYSLRIS